MDAREILAAEIAELLYHNPLYGRPTPDKRSFDGADQILAALAANQLAVVDTTRFYPVCRNCAGTGEIIDREGRSLKCPICSPSPVSAGDRR